MKFYLLITFLILFIVLMAFINVIKRQNESKMKQKNGYDKSSTKPKLNKYDLLLANPCNIDKLSPKISNESYYTQSRKYPVYPSRSTHINNIRKWKTPNNGSCVFPELCGSFYMNNN